MEGNQAGAATRTTVVYADRDGNTKSYVAFGDAPEAIIENGIVMHLAARVRTFAAIGVIHRNGDGWIASQLTQALRKGHA